VYETLVKVSPLLERIKDDHFRTDLPYAIELDTMASYLLAISMSISK
jgi:hypothetical protein